MSFENYEDIDNSALVKSSEWEGSRDNIVLKYRTTISARKCEKAFSDFDTEVKKALDPNKIAENITKKNLDAVDFFSWGRNPWHVPKDEVDAWNTVRKHLTNEDVVVASVVFKDDPNSFMDMQPYHEKTAEIIYAVNVTQAFEREKAEEKEM